MAFTTTINFPNQVVNNNGDYLSLSIVFTHDAIGINRVWDAYYYGMRVEKWGKLDYSYEIDDAVLVTSNLDLEISDKNGELDLLFYDTTAYGISTDKQALVTLKQNGTTKFVGNIIENPIIYDVGTKRVKITCSPLTDKINKKMVYKDGQPLETNYPANHDLYSIQTILQNIFRIVNPNILAPGTLYIMHDWDFKGRRTTDGAMLNNIKLREVYQEVYSLFFDTSFGINNYGDVLKMLAVDWASFTGMTSYDLAFFKKLFYYNPNYSQTVKVLSHQKEYKYGLIDYVEYESSLGDPASPYTQGTFTQLENRYIKRKSLVEFYRSSGLAGTNVRAGVDRTNHFVFNHGSTITPAPTEGSIYSNNGSQFKVVGTPYFDSGEDELTTERVSGTNNPLASGNLTLVTGQGPSPITYSSYTDADAIPPSSHYEIHQVRDNNLSTSFFNYGELIAMFWYVYRGHIQNCRVDKFLLDGINYDFLRDFAYDGKKYEIIKMTIDYSQSLTECEAIYVGEL